MATGGFAAEPHPPTLTIHLFSVHILGSFESTLVLVTSSSHRDTFFFRSLAPSRLRIYFRYPTIVNF
ncbi:hypothetical protein VTJ04DRAFT_3371 [Mycothermus thermophilus]|uniref:uncharacterized protein n=1 Tax=Humicola insolens TaxID=85995 RepID=UPI003743D970